MLFLSLAHAYIPQEVYNQRLGIELRLDLFPSLAKEALQNFLSAAPCPVMLTLRKKSHGGQFSGNEAEREALIKQLLDLEPAFFDLEYDMNPQFLHEVVNRYPQTHIILSYHHFHKVPGNLEEIHQAMQKYSVYGYKIAVTPHSVNEALKVLLFGQMHPHTSVICMGKKGAFARVLGPIMGNLIDYASLNSEEQTGPGQLTLSELTDVYHYFSLNKETSLYGLIGDPVEKSRGHLYHNALFRQQGLNAVYVKMEVTPDELAEFMSLALKLGFKGLSVTMPLKEKILPFVRDNSSAINTLLFSQDAVKGINTDGPGALDALEQRGLVQGKKVVLLGAGGAACGIAHEAEARGAKVVILNRTLARAEKLAADLSCEFGGLDEVPEDYDIMINCSSDPQVPIDLSRIRPHTIAMDVVYSPRETAFLQAAAAKHCTLIYGEEMFTNQAARQSAFWRDNWHSHP